MSRIVLWGRLSSANVQKAVWALEELGLGYEHIPAGGPYGRLDTTEYQAMNPNRLVPTLCDGDLILWESHAIVRYLAATYGAGTLFPVDPRDRAPVDQWTDWTATTFQPAWISLFWLLVRTPEPEQDTVAVAQALDATKLCFEIMERQLERFDFLAGPQFTYADLAAGVAMYRWATMPVERPNLPAVAAWHERLSARPAFVKGVCVSYEELRGRLAF